MGGVSSGKKIERKNRGHRTRVVCVCACEQEENPVSQLSPEKKKWCCNACRHLAGEWQIHSTDKSIGNILTRMQGKIDFP